MTVKLNRGPTGPFPTIDPKALGAILDIFGSASIPVTQAINLYPVIQGLVKLANQPYPIGVIDPAVEAELARRERDLAERESTISRKEERGSSEG